MDSNVLYKHLSTSHWMYIYTCLGCGNNIDDEENNLVCPKCGATDFDKKIGRWHSYKLRSSLWKEFLQALCIANDEEYLFEIEFKEASRG